MFENSKSRSSDFLPALESARGIAAFMVLLHHFSRYPGLEQLWYLTRSFYLSVDLFFVLSGYLLAKIYINNVRTIRELTAFLFLRIGRIYPLHLFWVLAFLTILLLTQHGSLDESQRATFWPTFFLLNSTGITKDHSSFNSGSWSLSAEWISYLLFGTWLLCTLSLKTGLRKIIAVIIAVTFYFLAYFLPQSHHLDLSFDFGYARGIGGFFTGVAAYLFFRRELSNRTGFMLLLFILCFLVFKAPKNYTDFAFPVLCFFAVTWLASPPAQQTVMSHPFLVWMGTVSYSVYLGHVIIGPAIKIIAAKVGVDAVAYAYVLLLVRIIAAYALSYFTYKLIEVPFRRLARGLTKKFMASS